MVFQFTAFDYINGMRLLQRHRADAVIFNDDLQGLATTALAALLVCSRSLDSRGLSRHSTTFGPDFGR